MRHMTWFHRNDVSELLGMELESKVNDLIVDCDCGSIPMSVGRLDNRQQKKERKKERKQWYCWPSPFADEPDGDGVGFVVNSREH